MDHAEMDLGPVVARSAADPRFRQRLLEDPKATLEDALKVSISDEVTIHAHQSSPRDVHLVVADQDDIDAELAASSEPESEVAKALRVARFGVGKAAGLLPAVAPGMYDWYN